MPFASDNPISRIEDDALGRASTARSFAQHILALDASQGLVAGVLGAWGSGKTSFINLARKEFEQAGAPILDFNPWMFSGAEQLVESFFVELAAQLKVRPDLAEVGKQLEDYGEAFGGLTWLPFVGPWIERGRGATKILSRYMQRRKEGTSARRDRLASALNKLDAPIVVVLDDIDRLTTLEIRHVFRLVRLTASFPRIIYVVAFDRVRVEKALEDEGVPGRDYLEKILQLTVDLPMVPVEVLNRQIFSAIDATLASIETPGRFEEQAWPDAFMEIIRPLVRNMRDIRRYSVAVYGTVKSLDGQVALVDLLALEAVRMFLPDVFRQLHGSVDALTTTFEFSEASPAQKAKLKAQIDGLINAGGIHADVVRSMIVRLFPAGQRHISNTQYGSDWKHRWLKDRQVAHKDILLLYLERVAGESLRAFTDAERAWGYLGDRDTLDTYLRSLEPQRLQDVIGALEVYETDFTPGHVVPATTVLLNLLAELPERQRGMFEPDTRLIVTRVTYRLLRSLNGTSAVESAVRQILPELTSLSAKLELIRTVGHQKGVGHKLVSETAASAFEEEWRHETRAVSASDLIGERELVRVLLFAQESNERSAILVTLGDAPELTLAVLRSARSEALSQFSGNRAVRRSLRLDWKTLLQLYGDEAVLRDRIASLRARQMEAAKDVLELTDKYLSGWRPELEHDERVSA